MVPGRPCRRRRLRLAGGPCDVGAGGPAYDGPGGNAGVLSLTSAFRWGIFMAKTLIVLGKVWLWAAVALTLLAYGYVWSTRGSGRWKNAGCSAWNALEVFAVLTHQASSYWSSGDTSVPGMTSSSATRLRGPGVTRFTEMSSRLRDE